MCTPSSRLNSEFGARYAPSIVFVQACFPTCCGGYAVNQHPVEPHGAPAEITAHTTPEQLAAFAASRPDLWPAIAQHPHTYPELRQWVNDRLAEQPGAPAPVAPTHTPAVVHTPAPAQFPASPQASAPEDTGDVKKSKKGLVVTLSVVGAVVLLAGAGAVLWFTGALAGPLHTIFGWDTTLSAEARDADDAGDTDQAGDGGAAPAKAEHPTIALPAGFAMCPDDTVPIAWAEFGAGWALICGADEATPSFAELKLPGKSGTLLSTGAQNPASAAAEVAIGWHSELERFTVDLEDATQATLDYEIGTLTVRDPVTRTTVAQHRLDRYVFLPMGTEVQTTADAAQNLGAFGVQAPTATAEDQVRYMIQVLETAYQGRELVKQALPKLQSCAAGPGGYTDTIAQMEAVRDNRSSLLQALDAMPVDLIPEGQLLLDDLRQGIEYSYNANVEYVAWAHAANASGCAQLSSAGQAAVNATDAPKQRFAERWNRVVAPQFGVRTFDSWYI